MIDIDTINFRRLLEQGVKFTITLKFPDNSTQTVNSSEIDNRLLCSSNVIRSPFGDDIRIPHFNDNKPTDDLDLSQELRVKAHVESCFKMVKQLQCKAIAKQYIKVLEPKKQSKHPYKLGNASKPSWWPTGIRHIEPDHLRKEERLGLLLAIVFHPKANFNKFKATTEGYLSLDARKSRILDEIYYVVDSWRMYQQGNMSAKTIKVSNFGKSSKPTIEANERLNEEDQFDDILNVKIPSEVKKDFTPRTINDIEYEPDFGSQVMGMSSNMDPYLLEVDMCDRLYPYTKKKRLL